MGTVEVDANCWPERLSSSPLVKPAATGCLPEWQPATKAESGSCSAVSSSGLSWFRMTRT
jgi:hypothetical protein